MFENQFKEQMDRLVGIFQPRGWSEISYRGYQQSFGHLSLDDFERMVTRCITECERMPKPFHMMQMQVSDHTNQAGVVTARDCEHCIGGRIWYDEIATNEIAYTRMAACDCKAGDVVAGQISQFGKAARRTTSTKQARYSFAMRHDKGIALADNGFGPDVRAPKKREVTDDPQSMDAFDEPLPF